MADKKTILRQQLEREIAAIESVRAEAPRYAASLEEIKARRLTWINTRVNIEVKQDGQGRTFYLPAVEGISPIEHVRQLTPEYIHPIRVRIWDSEHRVYLDR